MACKGGLLPGDIVVKLAGQLAGDMTHKDAQETIHSSGDALESEEGSPKGKGGKEEKDPLGFFEEPARPAGPKGPLGVAPSHPLRTRSLAPGQRGGPSSSGALAPSKNSPKRNCKDRKILETQVRGAKNIGKCNISIANVINRYHLMSK